MMEDLLTEFEKYFDNEGKCNNFIRKSMVASVNALEKGNDLYASEYHDSYIHKKILSFCSETIVFAPNDTDQLALGYNNRSVLLLHLCKYNECLIDIDRGLQIAKMQQLKEKLLGRKSACLTLIERTNSSLTTENVCDNQNELPKYFPSKQIPCAADCVSLQCNEKFGRHMIATRDIRPGEVIVVEKGYVLFPEKEKYTVCSHCLAFAWTGIPCDNCAFVIYCTERCKKEAWENYHDIECLMLPFLFCKTNKNVDRSTVMSLRLLIKAVKREGFESILCQAKEVGSGKNMRIKEFFHGGIFQSDTFKSCYNLITHDDTLKEYKDEHYFAAMIAYLFYRYSDFLNIKVDESTFLILESLFIKLISISKDNQYLYKSSTCICLDTFLNVTQEECNSLHGAIIAPFSSLINHSCCPNVSRMFLSGKIIMFSLQPIKKGEQLFRNYGSTYLKQEKEERQSRLQKLYNFTCTCEACLKNWPHEPKLSDVTYSEDLKFVLNALDKTSPLHSIEKWVYDEKTLEEAINTCESIYRYSDDYTAFLLTLRYRNYIDIAFYKIYGEKFVMPKNCKKRVCNHINT